jgi:hypothetical protein
VTLRRRFTVKETQYYYPIWEELTGSGVCNRQLYNFIQNHLPCLFLWTWYRPNTSQKSLWTPILKKTFTATCWSGLIITLLHDTWSITKYSGASGEVVIAAALGNGEAPSTDILMDTENFYTSNNQTNQQTNQLHALQSILRSLSSS